ncbi:response regulator [Aureisphaera galaxeae]|uniref:DNA-binding response regulator n=1 Tax=Aureisphaera galaxeae TaxID=1538023 RepID=UPI002350BEC3|nr:response regulator [Aureisphaera galaxeae]MDC8002736.1 response regulator [Aureisphaera galaxeae]
MSFTKVIVAEDYEDSKTGMMTALKELNIPTISQTSFCIDTYWQIKKALLEEAPFELLITDLEFTSSFGKDEIPSGEELIKRVREIQPELKIIVFTGNGKQGIIKSLMNDLRVEAHVCKGLNGLKELTKAIHLVHKGQTYICPVTRSFLEQKHVLQIGEYEIHLMRLLARGIKQIDIPEHLKQEDISPNSMRTVEDRISRLKDHFDASTPAQLVHKATKLGFL